MCEAIIIPEAPSWIRLTAVNTTALVLTWSASNNTDYYQVTCDSCDDVNVSSNETTYVIGRLVPGTFYSISVAACASQCSDRVNGTNNTSKFVSSLILSLSLSVVQCVWFLFQERSFTCIFICLSLFSLFLAAQLVPKQKFPFPSNPISWVNE